MKNIPQLDGIRCVAIISVIIGHWVAWYSDNVIVKNVPWAHGVIIFFVLSGYLITGILISSRKKVESSERTLKTSLRSFYFRRFIRIFPIYYFTVFALFFFKYKNVAVLFPWLVSYTSNIYMSVTGNYAGDFTHFWSLAVEEHFYLLWPFFILLINKKHMLKGIILIMAASFLSRFLCAIVFKDNWLAAAYFSLNLALPLALGGLIAYCQNYNQPVYTNVLCSRKLFYVSGIGYAVFLILTKAFSLHFISQVFDQYMFSVFSMFFVATASASGFQFIGKRILENKIVLYIGRISYGLYVYHMFVIVFFWHFVAPLVHIHTGIKHIWVGYLLTLLVIASLSYYIIEKPLMRLKKYFAY